MSKDKWEADLQFSAYLIIFIVFNILSFAIGASVGRWKEESFIQKEAVKRGAAVWSVDESGYVKFTWKETKEKENE
jgi:hypothetical protein